MTTQSAQSMNTSPDGPRDPEDDLLRRILEECSNTDLSAVHAVGVLHTAALLIGSQTYDLTNIEQESK